MARLGTGFAIGRAGGTYEEGLGAAAAGAGATGPALGFDKLAETILLVSLVLL